ncbi:MAG: lysine exporter LysO family protein [Rothia sp. (in: high G+C Gram-positive bacteria)]|uniref:lysine exporter LysO family protein n=1 Tax=Rothia sp. (in: high G+C Gram-positive bacteria) TaxID=1885016 RepID=UPI0026E05288|nr:lysine exporter LysO family protein [Rothia sp. (in: high G+C Gram-positive bacteria)]MDO5751374.1 lysine exporter LysO family protein [Rothia sp. (in: high G+C Gram-positive bacteria)]
MFIVILITLLGIVLGFSLRRFRLVQGVQRTITVTIYLMLFILGLSVGEHPTLMHHLPRFGGLALLLALVGILGSALAAKALYTYIYKEYSGAPHAPTAAYSVPSDDALPSTGGDASASLRQSLLVVVLFVLGCVLGATVDRAWRVHDLSLYLLYALMLQVGISIGCSDNLKGLFRTFRPTLLLLPLGTVVGTLLLVGAVSLLLPQWGLRDMLAVGSGLGYYSLSSILITQLKMPSLGEELATELGLIALLTNVLRELTTLVTAPWLKHYFGPLAPISAAGVTSVDVCLPTIARVCGPQLIPVTLLHGMVLDMSVPFLIPLFC